VAKSSALLFSSPWQNLLHKNCVASITAT